MTEITFSIVGTAGRNDDGSRLSKKHFEAMCVVAEGLLDQFKENNYPVTHLVSGGAAWADHVAVKLFLDGKVPHLKLFLPCSFEGGTFSENPNRIPFPDWTNESSNTARTLNYYHKKFQIATNINSLTQIQIARAEGAELIPVRGGFYGRNAMIAKSDFLLAMTFGNGKEVKPGGTSHTVKCYLDRAKKEGFFDKSFHYDLNSGEVFVGCTLPPKDETPNY